MALWRDGVESLESVSNHAISEHMDQARLTHDSIMARVLVSSAYGSKKRSGI